MAGSGRFGKYGDLKRKEQIRSTRVAGSGRGKALFTSAKASREDRPGKCPKKREFYGRVGHMFAGEEEGERNGSPDGNR